MRAVLDTNVIVSSTIVPSGNPAKILQAARDGAFELLASEEILAECRETLFYPRIRKRHRYSDEEIEHVVRSIRRLATFVTPDQRLEVVAADPDDNRILECALAGEADYIATGDHHLLDLRDYRGIPILSPAAFLLVLGQG